MEHLIDLGVDAVDWFETIRDSIRVRALMLAGACWLAAGALLLSLGTVLLGRLGDGIEAATSGLFGLVAWTVPFVLVFYGVQFARGRLLTLLHTSCDAAMVFAASVALGATLHQGGVIGNALGQFGAGLFGGGFEAMAVALGIVSTAVAVRWGFSPRAPISKARAKAAKGLEPINTTTLFQVPVRETVSVSGGDTVSVSSEAVTPVTPIPPVVATRGLRIAKASRSALPSLELLDASERPSSMRNVASEDRDAAALVQTLADHNIAAKVEAVVPGPQVTTFEVSIAAGTKVSRVLGLGEDLSFALGRKVRAVVSPVAARIGFEVPNATRQEVCLKSLLAANEEVDPHGFQVLPLALGLDVRGKVVTADLAQMPHVVVAGSTGSGKSVGLNAMILSLLFKRTSSEVRFVMIDCKQVELAPFDGIPHLMRPVITDAAEAASALEEVVTEMERRFALLSAAGVKNIASYNAKVSVTDRLARIVVIIDEYADLIMQQAKGKTSSVESAVQRLGQKARAAGIHMILATQRPSTDVVTGSIKANVPARIAFRVAQGVDSRVVLDSQGAEDLLGRGDALFQAGDGSDVRRIQFPRVSEQEVERVVSYLKGQS